MDHRTKPKLVQIARLLGEIRLAEEESLRLVAEDPDEWELTIEGGGAIIYGEEFITLQG